MASISTTSGRTEREPANACQGMVPSSSSSSPSSSQSLFSCCLDWVSPFLSWRSIESNSMASTSGTTGCIPENEGFIGAFQEIAPYSSTSGTCSIPIQKPSFDVFINHRGPDVKKTLATRIYEILDSMKVTTFLDSEELEYGDFLPTTIEAAIRGANLHIAIFSQSYAESAWCLEELSLMLKSNTKIFPIFYHVEPSDLRYVAQGKGKYVAAFNKHEKKRRYKPEKLQEWKRALSDVSLYSGQIIKNNGDEMRLFKNIVNIVLKEIRNVPLIVAKHPVGLNKTVEDFENTLQIVSSDQGVQIVGIWGMGGAGKTTLAKELYNRRSSSMEKSCFIFDIREAKDVLLNKQIQLLKGLGVKEPVDNIEQGKAILARLLRSFKVLIVMDDVDHVDQLDALVPAKDSLRKGSLIIVTTRECEVLTRWGIHNIYKMKALNPINAEHLFCWHAFLHPSPLPGFDKLVNKFVEVCDGLPLSLKVFGGQLYGNSDKKYWESLFHRISRILSNDIKDKLKVSYDALDDEEKEAFLDTACFFIGEESSLAIEVWDGSGWSGLYSWERLLNKCLVEVENNNRIRMHDHLRDLGREIASQHSPSRYWLSQQIIDSNKQIKKTNCIRGIKFARTRREERLSYEEHLSGGILFLRPSLVGLKLLVIEGDYFNQVIDEASRELLWLRWSDIRQRNLPAPLSLKNLRVLELYGSDGQNSLEELWEAESDAPVQLRELSISDCHRLRRFPNSIGCLNVLKKIVIRSCGNIESLPEEFCRLQLLEHLELSSDELSSLPSSFGDLTNLRYLNLSRCSKLRELPVSFKKLILLQYLNLEWCRELILRSDDFQNITKLELLNLSWCAQLEELPRDVTNQVYLRELRLLCVERLRELPIEIGQLSRLREMEIGSELLISFPNSLGNLSSLTNISIKCCQSLKSLPPSLGNLSSLKDLSIFDCPSLESLPTSLGNLSSLTDLSINVCQSLKSLPPSLGNLSSLKDLLIWDCDILESLPTSLGNLSSLTDLSINRCQSLKSLPPSLGNLSSLKDLSIWTCHSLESLPISFGNLSSSLTNLSICSCPISQVDSIAASSSFAFSNLMRLELDETPICRISISEDRYPRLESLRLVDNNHLTEIAALPVNLECLELQGSAKLEQLPSLARLTSLREFEVEGCDRIEKIEGLQHCTRLEVLKRHTCQEVLGIGSLEQMKNLRRVKLRANKGSAIQSCIQTIQEWPEEMIICMPAVPNASSLVDSFKLGLSPNLSLFDPDSGLLVHNHSFNGNAIMCCLVISRANSGSNLMPETIRLQLCYEKDSSYIVRYGIKIGEGRSAVIGVFPQSFRYHTENKRFSISYFENHGVEFEVERSFGVRGEKQKLVVEALLPLLQTIST